MKAKWIIQLACIAALVVATLGFSQPVQAGAKDPPDHPGPYKAGFTFKLLYDTERTSPNTPEGGRPIPSYIWYPAAPGDGESMPPALYPSDPLELFDVPPDPSTDYEQYGLDPAYQEVPPASDGPFPLVIFSPGLGCWAELYYKFGARLASYGFVVVVLTNYGDGTIGEPVIADEFPYYAWTAIDRTLDIQFLITKMLEANNDSTNLLHHLIRPDQIAVSGHSWGGYAAYALTGGDDLVYDNEPGYPLETRFPIQPDPRIKAIVALDGSSWVLHYYELSRIKIPHMTLNQEWDLLASRDPGLTSWDARAHSAVQGHPNFRVDITDAVHMSFSNVCSIFVRNHDLGYIDDESFTTWYPEMCYKSPENMLEVQNITTMYMVAFLKTALVGEPGYQYLLTPGYALKNEPLVEFFVTEKQNGRPNKPDWPEYFTYFMHQPGSATAQALKDPPKPKMERDLPIMVR